MSDSRGSFWSTVPGLVTGLAGLLTGIVGLITLGVQTGVVGGSGGSSGTTTTTTTAAPAGATAGGTAGSGPTGPATATTEAGSFALSPTALDFPPTDAQPKKVTVRNTSTSATLTGLRTTVVGSDADRFSVSLDTCTDKLAANLSCTLQVRFTPVSGAPLKRYSATVQVTATGATAGGEVALTASTLL